jgi:1-deoxy-D-xylulose 5-phosphate reductoisomerase
MVAYVDGSVLAQLGAPDMRTPIAYCLAWPDRMPAPSDRLDLARIGQLDFSAPDVSRFPCLQLARAALIGGQAMTICLNAANEVAVAAFLAGKTGFCDIAEVVETVIAAATAWDCETVDQIIEIDQWGTDRCHDRHRRSWQCQVSERRRRLMITADYIWGSYGHYLDLYFAVPRHFDRLWFLSMN